MQKTAAIVHPRRRGPTADAGCATATGRTKVRSAAVVAVAAWGATTPAKSTAKPTSAMVTTAATLLVETTVPSDDEARARDVETSIGHEPHVGPPGELHQQQQRERAERPEQPDLRVREGEMSDGEHQRHHDGGPDRALHDQEIGILGAEPAATALRSRRSRRLRIGGTRHRPAAVMAETGLSLRRQRPGEADAEVDPLLQLSPGPEIIGVDTEPARHRTAPHDGHRRRGGRPPTVRPSGPTRTRMPPWPLAATAMLPPTRKARPPNIFFSLRPSLASRPAP